MAGIFEQRYLGTNQIAGLGEHAGHVHTIRERFDFSAAIAANTDFESPLLVFPTECTPLDVRVVTGVGARISLRVGGQAAAKTFYAESTVAGSDSDPLLSDRVAPANAGLVTAANSDIEFSSRYPLLKFLKERRAIIVRVLRAVDAAGSGISRDMQVILHFLQL